MLQSQEHCTELDIMFTFTSVNILDFKNMLYIKVVELSEVHNLCYVSFSSDTSF